MHGGSVRPGVLRGVLAVTGSPLSEDQVDAVLGETGRWLTHAEDSFQLPHKPIPVRFDLQGRAAGMYRVQGRESIIRYNPYIFARYFEHGIGVTVPHEVAHYITDRVWGMKRVRPHGPEWCSVMQTFGVEPSASARFDLEGLPVRRQRRYDYRCECDTHRLSSCRHNRVIAGSARYHCRRCGAALVAV